MFNDIIFFSNDTISKSVQRFTHIVFHGLNKQKYSDSYFESKFKECLWAKELLGLLLKRLNLGGRVEYSSGVCS